MTRWPGRLGLLGSLALLLTLLPRGLDPAAAQTGGRLDLVAQTLFVDDEPVEIVLRVTGAPDDARLSFRISSTPNRSRESVRDDHLEPPTGGSQVAFFDCTLDGDCAGEADFDGDAGELITVTMNEERIGELLRLREGALPFVVELLDAGGDTLDTIATSLIVLDEPGEHQVLVSFLSQVAAPTALQPDQSTVIDTAPLLENALADRPELPATIALRPETLNALHRTDRAGFDAVLDLLGDRPLLQSPWVEIDEEGWRQAGETSRMLDAYQLGADTFDALAGTTPAGLVRLDPTARAETLALLRAAGAQAVVTSDEQLRPSTIEQAAMLPFDLLDDNGVAISALRIDGDLHETLDEPDGELAGYRALTELTAATLSADGDQGALLDLDRIDPVALDVVLTGIEERDELTLAGADALLDLDAARADDGTRVRGRLTPVAPDGLADLAGELAVAEAAIDTLAAMIEPETSPIAPLRTQLVTAMAADLSPAERLAYPRAVVAEVERRTDGVEIVPTDRITLTDRRTDLPLTIVNTQPQALNVELVLEAEKIRFPRGERLLLRLEPGENDLIIPVETLASGDARVTASVRTPGGSIELATGTVDIRSTAISGLGLLISVVALLVLGAWWIRTIRRVRRNRAAATVAAAPEDDNKARTEGGP